LVPKYRCTAARHGVALGQRACYVEFQSAQLDNLVLDAVVPLIASAVSDLPRMREALEHAWEALRTPETLHDALQERHRQQLEREIEQGRARLTKAAVLFADGDIDKVGYELIRDKARADLEAATAALDQFHPVEPTGALPPLETVLAAAEGWGAAMREGDIAAQREVLAALIERVVPVRVGRGNYFVEIAWSPLGDGLRVAAVGSAHAERSAA
jgi:hypothetical protein